MPALFEFGAIQVTEGALREIPPEVMTNALRRHVQGDWGIVDAEDACRNDLSLAEGSQIISVYQFQDRRFWVVTDASREVTTFLLPEEY
jgi:hypothetical protein